MAQFGLAFGGADERAVVDDHSDGTVKLARDGHREVVAATSHESDLNAAARGFLDGGPVGFGELPAGVQQRAVNIESYEAHAHPLILSWKRLAIAGPLGRPVSKGDSSKNLVPIRSGGLAWGRGGRRGRREGRTRGRRQRGRRRRRERRGGGPREGRHRTCWR